MENEENFLKKDEFPAQFKRQDVTKIPSFKQWKQVKEKEGKKIVRCPICWGYEIFVEPTNHFCKNCGEEYCQKCLKICVEDEVQHDHKGCCRKFCSLVDVIIDFGENTEWREPKEYFYTTLLFLFGTPSMFTVKYFQFFKENAIIDNFCVHLLFTILNLIANICYSIIYTILYFEIFFIIFFPSIFWYKYFKIIIDNWMMVYEYGVDECPITELTVCGRGYRYY